MPAAPVIGVPTALELASYGVWEHPSALTPMSYVAALERAGAIVMLIPPSEAIAAEPGPVLDRIDGLMLAGGCDIDPSAYGEPTHPMTRNTTPLRDRTEIALTRGAVDRGIPTLGICRGMQLINVAAGGTLHQHVPDVVGTEEHRRHAGTFVGNEHPVQLAEGSRAAAATGETEHRTLSHHHQAVDRVGDGLAVSGHANADGLIEAVEGSRDTYLLGVQWHPEADPDSTVVAALVAEARARIAAGRAHPTPAPVS